MTIRGQAYEQEERVDDEGTAGQLTQVSNETTPRAILNPKTEDGFIQLYRECVDSVYSYAMSMLRDSNSAEDVTAISFEKAYKKRHSFDANRGSPRSWLFGIVKNCARDELRSRSRLKEVRFKDDNLPNQSGATTTVNNFALRDVLANVPKRDRELLLLRFVADLDAKELSSILGVSESNISTRIHRALAKLRKVMAS